MTDANDEGLHPGPDTIQVPPGIYNLVTFDALPTITSDITIEGTGGASVTTITGADTTGNAIPTAGVLAVAGPGKLTVRGVTISGNRVAGTSQTTGGAIAAAGGQVVLDRSVLRGNRNDTIPASNGVAAGGLGSNGALVTISDSAIEENLWLGSSAVNASGGVVVANPSGSGLTITRASVSRNRADPPSGSSTFVSGGVQISDGTALTMTDSTVSQNSASSSSSPYHVGGILAVNSIPQPSTPASTLTNVTLTDNAAGPGGTFAVGNAAFLRNPGGAEPRVIRNSIVAGGLPVNCGVLNGAITSSGGNLEDANDCNFTGPGDLVNTPPLLEALAAAGGNVLGLAQRPLPASAAINRARPELCSATDQRGLARPQGAGCDSGAIETAKAPVNTALPSISGTPANGQTLTCNPGTFTESPALAFQWLSDGAAISGASSATFTVTGAQLDTAVQCQVLATNTGGQVVATSAAVVPPKPPAVTPPAPANTVRPKFTGLPRTGHKLTCSQGTFTGATSFAFAWLRNGVVVARAATYTLTAADAGKAIQCSVTATGPGGSVVADSAPGVPAKACIVPALTRQTLAAAKRTLAKANCALGRTTTRKSTKRNGTVIASSPRKGTNLAAGTKIALTLAKS